MIFNCCRFNSVSDRRWKYDPLRGEDCILLSVDRDIKLLGVCLFGSENTSTIEVRVGVNKSKTVLMHANEQFSPDPLQGEKFNYFGFKVLFDNVDSLQRNTEYYPEAKITVPYSNCGYKR